MMPPVAGILKGWSTSLGLIFRDVGSERETAFTALCSVVHDKFHVCSDWRAFLVKNPDLPVHFSPVRAMEQGALRPP